jgi:hypothetical protein
MQATDYGIVTFGVLLIIALWRLLAVMDHARLWETRAHKLRRQVNALVAGRPRDGVSWADVDRWEQRP